MVARNPPTPLMSYRYSITTKDGKPHRISVVELGSDRLEEVKEFTCGVGEQDDYLRNNAWKEQKAGMNKTLLFLEDGIMLGYITYGVSRVRIKSEDYCKKLGISYGPEPVLLIAQYAIAKSFQNTGAGLELLEFVKHHLTHLALELGGIGISLFCIMDELGGKRIHVYEKAGFSKLSVKPDDSNKIQMFFSFDKVFAEVYS